MPDTDGIILTGIPTREQALASGFVTQEMVEDGIVSLADLRADGIWEQDTTSVTWCLPWIKLTPEFVSARYDAQEAFAANKSSAEIALAAALIALEADLPTQLDGPWCAIAPNGKPYVVIDSPSGQPYVVIDSEEHQPGMQRVGCSTSAEAIAAWKRAMLEYAATHKGDILWWRYRPEIGGGVDSRTAKPCWIVYSRLVIGTPLINLVKRGERVPTVWDIEKGLITQEDIDAIGLVLSISTGEYRKPG